MRVVQVNCVYGVGSTGKIVKSIHEQLDESGIESFVLYGRKEKIHDKNVRKVSTEVYSKANNLLSRLTGMMYGGCFASTSYIKRIIKGIQPDIVHLHCINGYFVNVYKLIKWLNANHIKTILTMHAEFMYTGNCGYALDCDRWMSGCGKCPRLHLETKSFIFDKTHASWQKMKDAFSGFESIRLVAVSEWIKERALLSPITQDFKIQTIYNGIDVTNFTNEKNENDISVFDKYNLPKGKKIIIHITPGFSNPIKGGKYFLKLVKELGDMYHAVIVGCKEEIEISNLTTIPFVYNQEELAALYRVSSVMVITSVADNYPTVCLEANCCGTPVVGFDVGGVKEAIGKGMGEVVEFGNITELHKSVIKWAKITLDDTVIENRRKFCDSSRMVDDYIGLYKNYSRI